MAKIRCFLCGGRVSKGVCTECGMPQRQHVEDYDLNKSDCDDKPLTHVHEDTSYQTDRNYKRSVSYAEQQRKTEYRKAAGTQSGKQVSIVIIVVAIVILVVGCVAGKAASVAGGKVGRAVSSVEDRIRFNDLFDNDFDLDWDQESQEDYSALTLDDGEYYGTAYDISEDGAAYDAYLAAGYYRVGCHLPEGTYELSVLYGNGTIDVQDENNNIYIYEWLDSDENGGYNQIYNLQLYQGAMLYVSDGVELKLTTANAQSQKLVEGVPNELTETIIIDDEPLMAGRDFPAGVYDIYSMKDFGVVDIYVDWDEKGESDFVYLASQLIQSEDDADSEGRMRDYALGIYNVELKDGVYVYADGMRLELIPSETVFPQEGE